MNLFEYTYDLVRQIPPGRLSTYGAVAKALGDIRASRAVGRMMNQNPNADDMPCFKIVHSDGRLGGFGLGINDKIRRLNEDKIRVKDGRIIDFEHVFFDDFKTDHPLKHLRQEQITLSKQVHLENNFKDIETVAGIDVAYPKNEFDNACGACIIMDPSTKKILKEKTVFTKTTFPYISTYLAYRELPIIENLLQKLTITPSVFLIDGNGILHPYGLGIASHFGVMHEVASIGVAKNLLVGQVDNGLVKLDNIPKGHTLYASPRVHKPIYISPGHNISMKTSHEVVKDLCVYKIPEPIRQAHNLAQRTLHLSR